MRIAGKEDKAICESRMTQRYEVFMSNSESIFDDSSEFEASDNQQQQLQSTHSDTRDNTASLLFLLSYDCTIEFIIIARRFLFLKRFSS